MGKQVSRIALRSAVLAGIRDAYRIHKKVSRRRFGHAPEYWVTSMIARRLGKVAPGCGTELEASVWDVMKEAKANLPGRPPARLAKRRRFDIVLWWKAKASPRALIEVKHPVRMGAIRSVVADARRLMEALRRSAEAKTLDWACLAFYCQSSPKASRTKRSAREQIEKTTRYLKREVGKLDADRRFKARLVMSSLMTDASANGKEVRYGKACCISIRREAGEE